MSSGERLGAIVIVLMILLFGAVIWSAEARNAECASTCAPYAHRRLDSIGCLCNTALDTWTRRSLP